MKCFRKKLLCLVTSLVLIISSTCTASAADSKDFIKAQNTKFYDSSGEEYHIKAMGLGNDVWSAKGYQPYDHSEETYKELADLGFNAVRFYFRYSWYGTDKDANGNPAIWERFDRDIAWAKKYGIKIYFNLHYAIETPNNFYAGWHGYSLWNPTNDVANQTNRAKVAQMWEDIAKRYANEDTILGWGLMNEPITKYVEGATLEQMLQPWIDTANQFKNAIRKYDTNHILFIEPASSILKDGKTVSTLNNGSVITRCTNMLYKHVANNDNNFCFEYHNYSPWAFCSYGISDTKFSPMTQKQLNDRISYLKYLSNLTNKLKITPFLGEFGVSYKTFPSAGYKEELTGGDLVNATLDYCEKYNVSFSYHQYVGKFGLRNTSAKGVDNPDLINLFKTRLATMYQKDTDETATIKPNDTETVIPEQEKEKLDIEVTYVTESSDITTDTIVKNDISSTPSPSNKELPKTGTFNMSVSSTFVSLFALLLICIKFYLKSSKKTDRNEVK